MKAHAKGGVGFHFVLGGTVWHVLGPNFEQGRSVHLSAVDCASDNPGGEALPDHGIQTAGQWVERAVSPYHEDGPLALHWWMLT